MSWFDSLVIGLIQGLTEFLPISSSAHMKIAKLLFSIPEGEGQVVFDLMCHLGTMLAALYFLRVDIYYILKFDKRKLSLIFFALIPLIPFYFLLKPLRDYASQTHLLGLTLMITSCILFAGDRWRIKRLSSPSYPQDMRDVLLIGTMQAAALIPGISRSASTISCAHMLGWNAKEAVRFSFLLSIPTILGGNCLELLKLSLQQHQEISIPSFSCFIGFFASLTAGLIMIRKAIRLLEKGKLKPFAWYCLILGFVLTIVLN